MRTATVEMTVAGRKLRFQLDVPTGPTPPRELLPLFQALTDAFVTAAVQNAEAQGARVSCTKGCGACCRQLVPVSEVEIEALRALVDSLPEPRRSRVIARFENAIDRLSAAGLLDTLRAPERVTRGEIRALGDAYFRLGIACPFLEDESCSIHADRPLACREYLVTSPAMHCAAPGPDTVRCVPMHAKVSRAIRHLDTGKEYASATWIPMILALEWRRPERREARPPTAAESVSVVFREVTGKIIPEPDGTGMLG
jgi:Fe-S-cluster containining protein